jgi:outer membrane protein
MTHKKYGRLVAFAAGFILILGHEAGFAQKTRKLSLDEAIQLSIKNSGQLKIANAKVDEAIAAWHAAKDNYLPDLKASGSYLRLNSPNVDLKVKLGSGGQQAKPVKVDQAAYGIVNASLPVFSGFRIRYGVESAKYLEQAAKLDAENNRDEVIQNTISAYSNLYKARNSVDLVKENLQREHQRVFDFSNLEKNGLLARNDLLKAQLQESNIELSLLDAENNLRITTINMNLMLGLPEDMELVPDTSLVQKTADAGNILQWEQAGLQNRKDLASLSYREKAAVTAIKSAKGEYYPGLALTGGLIAADIPNLLTISNAMNIGIGLQYNVAALWKTGAKVEQANARLHQVQATEGILGDQVRLEVNKAYEDYMLSARKISVYEKAVEQANENYRITKNKFDNNLVTTTDLLDADVAQLQAMMNYSFSKVDAVVAFKKLQQTAGMLSK